MQLLRDYMENWLGGNDCLGEWKDIIKQQIFFTKGMFVNNVTEKYLNLKLSHERFFKIA